MDHHLVEGAPGRIDGAGTSAADASVTSPMPVFGRRVEIREDTGLAVDQPPSMNSRLSNFTSDTSDTSDTSNTSNNSDTSDMTTLREAESSDAVGVHAIGIELAGDEVAGSDPTSVHVGSRRTRTFPATRTPRGSSSPVPGRPEHRRGSVGGRRRKLGTNTLAASKFTTGTQYSGRRPYFLIELVEQALADPVLLVVLVYTPSIPTSPSTTGR